MDSAKSEKQQMLVPDEEQRGPFFSHEPRSGELSLFAQKLAAEAFVCLCSVVVFGSTANFSRIPGITCTPLCRFGIATGVVSFFISAIILVGQYLAWINRVEKTGWFSANAEKKGMIFLSIWWIIGAACLSALEPQGDTNIPVGHSSGIGIMFGWLALFGSIVGAYKSYHSQKEEERTVQDAQQLSLRAANDDEEFANFS